MSIIKDFLTSGSLGEMRLGMSISDVFSFLGQSEGVGKGLRGWTIESYSAGFLQIAHSKGVVGLIGIYFDPDKSSSSILPKAVNCEIQFSAQTTTAEFRKYLEDNVISYEFDTRLRDTTALKIGVGVIASFEDDHLRSLLISV